MSRRICCHGATFQIIVRTGAGLLSAPRRSACGKAAKPLVQWAWLKRVPAAPSLSTVGKRQPAFRPLSPHRLARHRNKSESYSCLLTPLDTRGSNSKSIPSTSLGRMPDEAKVDLLLTHDPIHIHSWHRASGKIAAKCSLVPDFRNAGSTQQTQFEKSNAIGSEINPARNLQKSRPRYCCCGDSKEWIVHRFVGKSPRMSVECVETLHL